PDARNLDRARELSRGAAPIAISYDPQDATARLIVERIAVNAREAGLVIRPAAGASSAAGRIARARIHSADTGLALASLAATLGLEAAPNDTLYAAERTMLQGYRVVPLFH